jgi:hypothetical protein
MKNIAFISCFYNPVNFRKPVQNCFNFLKYTVNKAFSADDFFFAQIDYGNELDISDYVKRDNRISIKTESILWHKERLLNLLVEKFKLTEKYKYICWLDTDIIFEKRIIVPKDFDAIAFQPYEYSFRPKEDRDIDYSKPFFMGVNRLECFCKNKDGDKGLSWAVESEYLDEIGGFFDYGIVGGGDTFFLKRVFGEKYHTRCKGLDQEINTYAENSQIKKKEINYLDNSVYHQYHGKEGNRQYSERIKILIENNYVPQDDLIIEKSGLYRLKNKDFEAQIKKFFTQRKEDG